MKSKSQKELEWVLNDGHDFEIFEPSGGVFYYRCTKCKVFPTNGPGFFQRHMIQIILGAFIVMSFSILAIEITISLITGISLWQ